MQPAESLRLAQVLDEEVDASQYGGPLEWYWHFSQRNDFQTDSEQLKVFGELQRLFEELEEYRQYRAGKLNRLVTHLGAGKKPPRGIYLWIPRGPLATEVWQWCLVERDAPRAIKEGSREIFSAKMRRSARTGLNPLKVSVTVVVIRLMLS